MAKLRMHTDETLQILDDATISLGRELRAFASVTCPAFPTRELNRANSARLCNVHEINMLEIWIMKVYASLVHFE